MAARTIAPISNVQYEDLRPKSEWKEENTANVLHIHLPDFKKEQIKITYVHSTRIIRVTGERQIAGTKWARFNQTFAVPQNCEVNNIHAKFADGILTLMLPKSNVTPIPSVLPKQNSKLEPQATATKPSNQEASAAATPKPAIPAPPAAAITQDVARTTTEANERKGAEETKKPDVPRAPSLREVLKDTKPVKGQEEQAISKLPVSPPPPGSSSSKIMDGLVKQKEDSKRKEAEEIGKKRKESSSSEGVKKRKEYSLNSGTIKEEDDNKKNGPNLYDKDEVVGGKMKEMKRMTASAKEALKGRFAMEMGEDRQRSVNVGVAVLVIAAVGVYLYYSYRPSSSSSRNYGQEK